MDTFLHVALSPTHKLGEDTLDLTINRWGEAEDGERLTVYKIPVLNAPYNDSTRLELWIISALRNMLTAVEADMFSRLVGEQEKLTLEPMKRQRNLCVACRRNPP